MNLVGISPLSIFPKMVSSPGLASCAFSTSLAIVHIINNAKQAPTNNLKGK